MNDLSIFIAFTAGLVSFIAPCVLPLIPGFLAYLSGGSATQKTSEENLTGRREIFLNSVFFVLGFSVVFSTLGVLLNTTLAFIASDVSTWLSRIGGALIIFFGLYLTGLIRVGFLEQSHVFSVTRKFRIQYVTSFVFGVAFASGWTPCVGAVLGAILGLATSTPGSAFVLLFAYSLGLGLPFLAVGLFAGEATALLQRIARVAYIVNIIFGVILIVLGILVFTGELSRIASFEFLNRIVLSQ